MDGVCLVKWDANGVIDEGYYSVMRFADRRPCSLLTPTMYD